MKQWLEIESAPKDGSFVWLWCDEDKTIQPQLMRWDRSLKLWTKTIFGPMGRTTAFWDTEASPAPTHWSPL